MNSYAPGLALIETLKKKKKMGNGKWALEHCVVAFCLKTKSGKKSSQTKWSFTVHIVIFLQIKLNRGLTPGIV